MALPKTDIANSIAQKLQDASDITAQQVREVLTELLDNDYYTSSLPDSSKTGGNVGGIPANTSITKFKGRHYNRIIDELLFGNFAGQAEGTSIPHFSNAENLMSYEGESRLAMFNTEHEGIPYTFLMIRTKNELEREPNKLTILEHIPTREIWMKVGGTPVVIQHDFGDAGTPVFSSQFFIGYFSHEIKMTQATQDLRFLPDLSLNGDAIEFGEDIFGKVIFELP